MCMDREETCKSVFGEQSAYGFTEHKLWWLNY